MADSRESVILDVKLDAGRVADELNEMVTRIAALKKQQKELSEEIKAGNDIDGKYAEQLIRVKEQLSWTEKQAKGLSATTKLLNADTLTYSDSLNGERQKLADMQKAYDQLDKAQRESEGGKAFLQAIKDQHDAVLGLEGATGRMQRNVGNYPKVLTAIVPSLNSVLGKMDGLKQTIEEAGQITPKALQGMAGGFKAATSAAVKFIMTPIGAILAAIVVAVKALSAAFGKLSEAFQKNDEAGTNLAKFMAIFKPIIDAVSAAFDRLASTLGKVLGAIADFVGGLSGAVAASQELVTAQDNLEQAEREYTENSARRSRDIARLRNEAKTSADLEERERKLKEAIELERQNLEDEKALQAERLRLLEENAKAESDTSDETANKIAAARAAMYKAEEDYYNGTIRLNNELISVENARAKAAEDAAKKEEEERKKRLEKWRAAEQKRKAEAEALAKEQAENAKSIQQAAEDFTLSLIEDATERQIAARKLQGERELAQLRAQLADREKLTAESAEQLAQLIAGKEAQLAAELNKMATDAANKITDEEAERAKASAQRILELRLELAKDGSAEELELQKQLLDARMQQALDAEELTEEEKLLIREKFNADAARLDDEYLEHTQRVAEDAKEAYRAQLMNTADAAGQAFGAISQMLANYGEENKEAARASKAFGLLQIITDEAVSIADTAKSITAAVAGATEAAAATGVAAPFTLPVYIASMTASVLGALAGVAGTIAQAKQLLSKNDAGKFEHGGVVRGTSYTGDNLVAHVNSAETILPAHMAGNLLYEIAQNPARGGFDYDQFAGIVTQAVAALPAPVVVYSELREYGDRVVNYDELAKI